MGAAWRHVGWGDTREGMLEWGSARKECIPMGILGLWGWAGGLQCWGHHWGHMGWGDNRDTREGMLE